MSTRRGGIGGSDLTSSIDKLTSSMDRMSDAALEAVRADQALTEANEKLKKSATAIEGYTRQVSELESTIEGLNERINELESADDKVELKQFRETARTAAAEVQAFLKSVRIDPDDWRFSDWVENVRAGSQTATQAISEIKASYSELIHAGSNLDDKSLGIDLFTHISTSFEMMSSKLDEIFQTITSIIQNGVKTINSTDVSSGGNELQSTLQGIGEAAASTTKQTEGSSEAITGIVHSLSEFSNVDEGKLQSIASTFRGLAAITENSFGVKTLDNISRLITSLQVAGGTQSYSLNFDVTGLNGLNVKKASLANLATYLPTIAKETNVKKLQQITALSFDNLNNLKVSKASIEHITRLTEAIQILKEAKAANIKIDDASINIEAPEKIEAAAQGIKDIADSSKDAVASVENLDGKLREIAITTKGFDASYKKVFQDLGGATATGTNSTELETIRQKYQELMQAVSDLRTKSKAATDEDISNVTRLRKEYQELVDKAYARIQATEEAEVKAQEYKNSLSEIASISNDISKSVDQAILGGSWTTSTESRKILDDIIDKYNKLDTLRNKGTTSDNILTQEEIQQFHTLKSEIESLIDALKRKDAEEEKSRKAAESKKKHDDAQYYKDLAKAVNEYIAAMKQLMQIGGAKAPDNLVNGSWEARTGEDATQNEAQIEKTNRLREEVKRLVEQKKEDATVTAQLNRIVEEYQIKLDATTRAQQKRVAAENDGNKILKDAQAEYSKVAQALQNWTKAEHSRHQSSRDAYNEIKLNNEALFDAIKSYDGSEESIQRLKLALDNIKKSFASGSTEIQKNGDAVQSLGDKFKKVIERFSMYLSTASLLMRAIRIIRQMIQNSIELESAFANLKIITGATDTEMAKFADTAIRLSKSLGQSVTDVTKSIETFSRLGYTLEESSKLAEYATMMANVAGVQNEEATTGITSIIKGFNLDVEQAEHIADVLVNVGQKYAVSASEMMEAYEKSGAALNATNTSFEKSAGLIAAANSAVQNSAVVGTALKTVSARIRGFVEASISGNRYAYAAA